MNTLKCTRKHLKWTSSHYHPSYDCFLAAPQLKMACSSFTRFNQLLQRQSVRRLVMNLSVLTFKRSQPDSVALGGTHQVGKWTWRCLCRWNVTSDDCLLKLSTFWLSTISFEWVMREILWRLKPLTKADVNYSPCNLTQSFTARKNC